MANYENSLFSGMNNLGNALTQFGQQRRTDQQNALLMARQAEADARNREIYAAQKNALLQAAAQERAALEASNQQRAAENFAYQNMPFIQGQPGIYNEQAGVLMQDVARQYPQANLAPVYKSVQGMAPEPAKADTFSDAGYGQQRNNRTGEIIKVPTAPRAQTTNVFGGGKPPVGYRFTANGDLEAIPGGPAAQKQQANAQDIADGSAAIDYSSEAIDRLLNHPGREVATGLSSKLDPRNYTPGTDAYNFNAELESFDAKLFLSNIQQMKGMGALSNAEGAKVSAAAGAIKPGMSEKAFVESLNIIKNELAKAKARKETGQFLPVAETQPTQSAQRPPLSAFQR